MSDIDREMKETFGFVPKFYDALPKTGREGAWRLQKQLELADDTALDPKTKELIGLAMASHIKCKYCMYFHRRTSETFGATPEELREAIAMGGTTVFFSNSLSGMGVDFDEFKREVERAIEHMKSR